jgi:hypothetical protein
MYNKLEMQLLKVEVQFPKNLFEFEHITEFSLSRTLCIRQCDIAQNNYR